MDSIYLTTDCDELKALAREFGINVIDRPRELSQDDSELVDAITHAMAVIGQPIRFLITMHCNCGVHRRGLIDECISVLERDDKADSCVSGRIDNSSHPFRVRQVSDDGHLIPWLDVPIDASSNRQKLSPCFILDGAVRVMRVARCFPPTGSPPFAYLGQQVRYVENEGPGDVHSLTDISATEHYWTHHGSGP